MGIQKSAMPEFSSSAAVDEDFTWRRSQWLGICVLGLLLIALAVVLFLKTRDEGRDVALLLLLAFLFAVNGALAYSRLCDFRRIRVRMESEHQRLEEANVTLNRIDDELQSRIVQERNDRAEHRRLVAAAKTISVQFKGTLASDQIAESMAEGLGRELGADRVICYSFDESLWPGFVKQWNSRAGTRVDESLILGYESALTAMVQRLWSRKRVINVPDSHLLDVPSTEIPELVGISKEFARSWVISPVADGTSVLGFVAVAMVDDARVWSSSEIALIQQVCSEAASVCVHARMSKQLMQLAENDSEVERLVGLDKVKNDFIENMNHELRIPLTSIIGYMEVIMDDVDARTEPELASSLTAVQRNAIRLQILIENMMRISKTDFEHVPLRVSTVDIGHLLGDVVNSLRLGAEDYGVTVTLRLDSPAGDLTIDGDVNQLGQVFINLISNAIKFTPRGGTVTVVARRLHAGGDFVEVKVTDTGIGIPRKEFSNVFKRFFRASTATEASIPGFGIGLSLVHSIVREHRGTIAFDSKVGKGTVFTVVLPPRYVSPKPSDPTA